MKNIIFKSLVIGALVFGVSIVANAQDTTKPVYKVNELKQVIVKDSSPLRAIYAERVEADKKTKRVVPKSVIVKEAAHFRLEKAPEKRVVK